MIHRDPSQLGFRCIWARTGAQIGRILSQHAGSVALADLSLGAWRSHQIARELAEQIGLPWPLNTSQKPVAGAAANRWLSYADLIGRGIEEEAKGKRAVREACQLAEAVVNWTEKEHAPFFVVLAPRAQNSWGNENLQFLYFLSHGLRQTPATLAIVCTDEVADARLPKGWTCTWETAEPDNHVAPAVTDIMALIPSTIGPALASAFEDTVSFDHLVRISDEYWLVPPELRPSMLTQSDSSLDELAQSPVVPRWLRGYAQTVGKKENIDELFLLQQSWQAFAEGGADLAIRLAERAVEGAREEMTRAIFEAQLRGMELAVHRFVEAAGQAVPSPLVPAGLRGFLLMAKGWGLTMSGNPAEGRMFLTEARSLMQDRSDSLEYLYLLNILALSHSRSEDIAGSVDLEFAIRAGLDARGIDDYRIRYVNNINLARLYVQQSRFDEARVYYADAFKTTMGTRTEAERIYSNVCLARVAERESRREDAFLYWFRAALHFCACQIPEAICSRYVGAILANTDESLLAGQPADLVERMARRIAEILRELAPEAVRHRLDADASRNVVFLTDDAESQTQLVDHAVAAVGGPGWSVLARQTEVHPAFDGLFHRTLRGLLGNIIGITLKDTHVRSAPVYIVDSKRGCEMPTELRSVVETCVRRQVPEIVFGSDRFSLPIDTIKKLNMISTIRPNPSVHKITLAGDDATIEFKRFWPEKLLSDNFRLLRGAGEQTTLGSICAAQSGGTPQEQIVEEALRLQSAGILSLELGQDWRQHLPAAGPT